MQNKSGRRSSYRILKIICLSLMFLLSVFLFTGTVRARESGGEYVQKRYRNSEYGYDLKFPSDWELCEDLSPVYSYMSYPPYHRMCIQTRQAGFGAAELYKITVDVLGKISGMLIYDYIQSGFNANLSDFASGKGLENALEHRDSFIYYEDAKRGHYEVFLGKQFTTFLTSESSRFIYSITVDIRNWTEDIDILIHSYNQAVSDFRFARDYMETDVPVSVIENDTLPHIITAIENNNITAVKKIINDNPDLEQKYTADGLTPLMLAARFKRKSIAKYLINKGSDINAKSIDGYTVLSNAIRARAIDVIDLLIDKGVDINKLSNKFSPLDLAIGFWRPKIVNMLVENGADADKAFLNAIAWKRLVMVKLLVDSGIDINKLYTNGNTPLIEAVQADAKEIALFLIDKGAKLNIRAAGGKTALIAAIESGDAGMLKLLTDAGADIDVKDKSGKHAFTNALEHSAELAEIVSQRYKETASLEQSIGNELAIAIRQDNEKTLKALIKDGADPDSRSMDGMPVLMWALKYRRDGMIKHIIGKGADTGIKDINGIPLIVECVSAKSISTECFEKVLSAGADPDSTDDAGTPIIMLAQRSQSMEKTKLLVKYGADINKPDKKGVTVFMAACADDKDNEKAATLVEYLIASGADIELKDKAGKNALMYSVDSRNPAITRLLLKKGARMSAVDKSGINALKYAINNKEFKTAKVFIDKDIENNSIFKFSWMDSLDEAVREDRFIIIKNIIEAPKFDLKGVEGYAALMIAISNDKSKIVKLFLKRGVDVNYRPNYSSTPVSRAVWEGKRDIIELLRKNGAELSIKDHNSMDSYMYAAVVDALYPNTDISSLLK